MLRLTLEDFGERGFVLFNTPLSTANGLVVTFDMFIYAARADSQDHETGGNGLALVFVDGSTTPADGGPNGASLGYSQLFGAPGVAGGYLGVGFDEFGTFSNSIGKGTGCSVPGMASPDDIIPESIAIRGAGSGTNGYCFLASSASLSPGLSFPSASVRTEAMMRRARVTLTAGGLISVDLDRGAGFAQVIAPLSVVSAPDQPALPSTLKLALAGSTGGATSLHEVRNLNVTTLGEPLTATPAASPTTTPTGTPTATPSASLTPTPAPDATATLTPAPAGSTTPSATPTPTSAVPGATPTPGPTDTLTPTPGSGPTHTPTLVSTASTTLTPRGGPPGSPVPPASPPATGSAAAGARSDVKPTPTSSPTPLPDCGQTGRHEEDAPVDYASNPSDAQGRDHAVYGSGPLLTLSDRDAFRASLPPGTNMGPVNDAIARGCSASWIRSHLGAW